jgi:hypothetical protein
MKNFVVYSFLIFSSLLIFSCGDVGSYYEQISENKTIVNRVSDLNKSIDNIRKEESGNPIKEGLDFLEYEYAIGDNDSYVVSYIFDEKGCFEIGIDCYFATKEDAINVLEGFKSEINTSPYGAAEEDNNLCRWKSKDESVSIELDYENTERGMLVLTIMANE